MPDEPNSVPDSPQREVWQAGDYTAAAHQSTLVGELLCEAVLLRAGERVLDVACGTGMTTLAAARRLADVEGVDFASNALEAARSQAAHEGFDDVVFTEGDAEALPYPDASFDVILSTFGAQFVADQEAAARELLRVCRSGGRIGLANWSPRGFFGQFFKLMADYAPPEMRKSPMPDKPGVLWGTEERLQDLFGAGISSMKLEPRIYRSRYLSVDDWVEKTRSSLGPVMQILHGLTEDRGNEFLHELTRLVERSNTVAGPDVLLESEYLEVVMIRR